MLVLINDVNGPVSFRHFKNMGATKVAAPDKVCLVCDHFAPAPAVQTDQAAPTPPLM